MPAMIEGLAAVADEYYGGTESGAIACRASEDWPARPGTVGRAGEGSWARSWSKWL